MRHFADELKDRGYLVYYVSLDDPNNRGSLKAEIKRWIEKTRPQRLICARPGDYRVLKSVQTTANSLNCELDVRTDRHFMSTIEDFKAFAVNKNR